MVTKEADLKKRLQVIEERRKNFDLEWNKLNEEEKRLDEKKAELTNRLVVNSGQKGSENGDEIKLKYEIEKLKLEKTDLEAKFENVQKLLGKFYKGMGVDPASASTLQKALGQHAVLPPVSSGKLLLDDKELDRSLANSEELEAKLEGLDNLAEIEDENDDDEIKELIKHAKLKLKLKYYNAKKLAELDNLRSGENEIKQRLFDSDQELDDGSDDDDDEFKSSGSYKLDLKSNNSPNLMRKDGAKLFDSSFNRITLRRSNIDIEAISDQKRYLIDNIAKEKDALHIANELMEKYRETLIRRQLQLETAKLELKDQEKAWSKTKLTPSQSYQLEEKRIAIDKAQIEVDQLNLNLKNGKRLIQQKRAQLNLLENSLLDHDHGLDPDSAGSADEFNDEVNGDNSLSSAHLTTSKNTNNTTLNVYHTSETNAFSDLSMKELLLKLQNLQTNGELDMTNMQRIQPILKKLPKLNRKLQSALQNLNTNNVESKNTDIELVKLATFVEERWQKYVGLGRDLGKTTTSNGIDSSFSSRSNPLNKLYTSNLNSQFKTTWESSPAYHRLAYDSGTRMLDEKWNQYMGANGSLSNKLRPPLTTSVATDLRSISKIIDYTTSTSKLPESTQHRINQHRDWLKRFKADNSKLLL